MIKSVPAHDERLGHLEKVVVAHEVKVTELEKETSGATLFKSDSPADAVRSAEIRGWFAKIDRAEQISMLHEAVRNGDADSMELIAAVVSAPGAMQLIPREIKKALVDAVAERRYPEKIAELNRRRKACEIARFGITRAREILQSEIPQSIRDRLVVGSK